MVRNFLLVLSILCCSMIFMQSCVHGDLDDCPPMVRYAVTFEYTRHIPGNIDLFYNDVKLIYLYVFDKDFLFYKTEIARGEYDPPHFSIPLDLPMGKYNMIAWCNTLETQPFSISPTPTECAKGTTRLQDVYLTLKRQAGNLSSQDMERLFYGQLMDVEIPLYVSRVDTIKLVNDTKRVRVVIHWDHSGALRETQDVVDFDEVQLHLNASNAKYNYLNTFTETNNVTYNPYISHYESSILDRDTRQYELLISNRLSSSYREITNSCVYDFTILRMMPNSPINLIVERKKQAILTPVNLINFNIIPEFTDVFTDKGYAPSQWQEAFDRYENYRIDLYFTYDQIAGEYVTGNVFIEDWHNVDQPTIPD